MFMDVGQHERLTDVKDVVSKPVLSNVAWPYLVTLPYILTVQM